MLRCKVFVKTVKNEILYRIELTSEKNLYFYFIHEMNQKGYELMKMEQGLTPDFCQYGFMIVKLLELTQNCSESNSLIAVKIDTKQSDEQNIASINDIMKSEGGMFRLDFIKEVDVKYIELLSINFY